MSKLKRNKAITEHKIWVGTASFSLPRALFICYTELNPSLPKATKIVLPSRAVIKLQESVFWCQFWASQKYGFGAIVHFCVRGHITNDCLESCQLLYPQRRFQAHLLVQGITT